MSVFLQLLQEKDKAAALAVLCRKMQSGKKDQSIFNVLPAEFDSVPGKPFAYWVSENVRGVFKNCSTFESHERFARQGMATADDFRFVRTWWEAVQFNGYWFGFAKGGAYSPFYSDIYLIANWSNSGSEIRNYYDPTTGKLNSRPQNIDFFSRPGLTWPRRTTSGLSMRALPADSVFADKGPAAFVSGDNTETLLALLAITNSCAFGTLVSLQLAAADAAARSYEVGVIQKTPMPSLNNVQLVELARKARYAWSITRNLDTIVENSHAFVLPAALRLRQGGYDPQCIGEELLQIKSEINNIVFDLYNFSYVDRLAAQGGYVEPDNTEDSWSQALTEEDAEETDEPVDNQTALLSWTIGVAFGRFDIRLATGARTAPLEPAPFDPLPAKSPGMLPDGDEPYHHHPGILVDDPGHPHDLPHLIETVLDRVNIDAPQDIRRWLQKDFFPFHLQRYSKSRRKAPIYWPLSTVSGNYTLWLYYPTLSHQTLYTAINDFLDPKLKDLSGSLDKLRAKGPNRSRDEEKALEAQQQQYNEISDLKDSLLKIAPQYHPNHDDGVQITAAPLWSLFRHKPWQKVLKDTWAKLEKGDYDWAHLAMNYWPDRVREKCKTDKSLAITHELEELFVDLKKKSGGATK